MSVAATSSRIHARRFFKIPTSQKLSQRFFFRERFRNAWQALVRVREKPVSSVERRESYAGLLALARGELGRQHPDDSEDKIYKLAADRVDREVLFPILGEGQLRYEISRQLAPQVVKILQAFSDIDKGLPSPESTDSDDLHQCRTILLKEYETCSEKASWAFWRQKESAIRTLLSYHGWADAGSDDVQDSIDAFGVNVSEVSDRVFPLLRRHQTINLCRSILLREELGYSVLVLRSSVPGAGRGLFLEGLADPGSIICFTPGDVWPREYLTQEDEELDAFFRDNENHQLFLRFDEVLLDSRRSPYTNLSKNRSNPWALGHVINHPPPDQQPPNSLRVLLNFYDSMNVVKMGLERYIPNVYARQPPLFGARFFDREPIDMHGLCSIATRQICNEEIFTDYRLNDDSPLPDWYHPVALESSQ